MILLFPRTIMALCARNRISNTLCKTAAVRKFGDIKNNPPELTRIRYPDVQRGNYAQLQEDDVLAFKEILDGNRVITEESDLEGKLISESYLNCILLYILYNLTIDLILRHLPLI